MILTAKIHNLLGARLKKTQKDLEMQVKKLQETPDFGSDVDSLEEEAEESEEYGNRMASLVPIKERLMNVNHALSKFKEGKYGICERCGKEISLRLLMVNPESRLCRDCKKKI